MTMQGSSKNNSAGEKMEGRVSKESGEFNIKQADVSNVSPLLERMTTGEKVEIQEERGYYLRSLHRAKSPFESSQSFWPGPSCSKGG